MWQLIRRRQLELVHGFVYNLSDGGLIAARLSGVPFIAEIGDDPITAHFNGQPEWRRYWGTSMERRSRRWLGLLLQQAEGVITLSEHLARHYQEEYRSNRAYQVLPQAVDLQLFQPRDSAALRTHLGFSPGTVVIGFAGSLTQWHGVHVLIKSLSVVIEQCPEAAALLVVGGTAHEQRQLRESMRATGLPADRIRIESGIPYESMPEYYSAADICVAPHINDSPRPLGCSPKKITEYFACGRPVICSDLPELREMAGEAAVYVKPGDADALAVAIVGLVRDPELRRRLGKMARRRAIFHFDRTDRLNGLLEFYASVLNHQRRWSLRDLAAWSAIQTVRVLRQR
jgi:glycosyltransferase involved in cell wall biosynthesis